MCLCTLGNFKETLLPWIAVPVFHGLKLSEHLSEDLGGGGVPPQRRGEV